MFVENVRKDFPYLKENKIYLDSAATTQKPKCVIEAEKEFYEKYNGNAHSMMHYFANAAYYAIDNGRKVVSEFIGADKNEIAFTKSATESLNTLVFGIEDEVEEGNEILVTILEHHANLLPYMEMAKKKKAKLVFVYLTNEGKLDYSDLKNKVTPKTKIIGLTACSNVTGEDINIEEIVKNIKEKNSEAYIIIDAAQSVNHKKIDVKKIDIYGLAFSGHKLYGPLGVGVMYINNKYKLDKIKPHNVGGGIVELVSEEDVSYVEDITKFESGTMDGAAILGLTKAIEYINNIGMDNIEQYLKELTKYAYNSLKEIPEIKIYSHEDSVGIVSFEFSDIHSHDIATFLNNKNICVRVGHHCAMPYHKYVKSLSTVRVSFGIYNTKKEIDLLKNELLEIRRFFING